MTLMFKGLPVKYRRIGQIAAEGYSNLESNVYMIMDGMVPVAAVVPVELLKQFDSQEPVIEQA